MSISLKKGQNASLTKGNPGLKKLIVGLGWDVNEVDEGMDFDLDASAFMLDKDGKCPSGNEFIFYGNLEHSSKSVIHQGDNCTGEGEGDDEQILINLHKIPDNIEKIVFTVTIYEAQVRWQNFGQISNAYIRIINMITGEELLRYDLGEEFSIEAAIIVGELYKSDNEWKFNAVGNGVQGELAAICADYGVDAE